MSSLHTAAELLKEVNKNDIRLTAEMLVRALEFGEIKMRI
jgi:hypothetical protein